MISKRSIQLFIVSGALIGCNNSGGNPITPPAPPAPPPTYSVTVTNGSSSRIDVAPIHVWANPPGADRVFAGWTGDTDALVNPLEYHTTLKTSGSTVNITATYKTSPPWTPTVEVISGTDVDSYFPPNPVGVIILLHGTGGNASSFFKKADYVPFVRDAVADGYAVVSLSSTDRVNKQWDNSNQPPNNPDIQNVQDALATFTSRGRMTDAMPRYALGMSQGGGFALSLSLALGFKATTVFCAAGLQTVIAQTTVPTTWNLAQNDTIVPPATSGADQRYQSLVARGVDAAYNVNTPSPLYPSRFATVPGLTTSDSQVIYDAFKNANPPVLDANGYLIADPEQNAQANMNIVPVQYQSYSNDIEGQLEIAYTQHEFYADRNRSILAFFDAHR
jgi:dienelactone hydrolase